ncbi:15797_t:CDS:1, partial [Racocetra fulgida]
MFESSSATISNTRSIIDIIADDIEFSVKSDTSTTYNDIHENQKKRQPDYKNKTVINLDKEDHQSKRR